MADKDDDLVVNVDDLDTVAVDVTDDPTLATAPEKGKTKEIKPKETKIKRVTLDEPTGPTPEEALAQAQAYSRTQEDARRAAEATAASERTMREQAQRDAQQAQQTAEQLRERASNSELANIESGIASAQRELDAQTEAYTRAAEAGEFAKMAAIQVKLSKAAAQIDRLEDAKANFDTSSPTQAAEGAVTAPVAPQGSSFDRYLAQFSPVAQNWLRMHPDCVHPSAGGDETKYNAMMAGHYAALGQKIREGTPEYFKAIEDHITPQQAAQSKAADVQVAGETKAAPKQVQLSAPPSRDTSTPGSPRSIREVKLTKDQQEMAKVSFPHLPEAQAYGQYARNLIELEAEGKIGRSTH